MNGRIFGMPILRCALPIALAMAGATPAIAGKEVAIGLTTTGQPTTVTLSGEDASVTGFRSATWGMTPDQVRAAIARDFGGAQAGPLVDDPVGGTRALIAPMASLSPGPGPAAITYIFGGKSGGLIHVNLDWTVRDATAADRATIVASGAKAVADFAGSFWALGSVMRGVVVAPDVVVLFAGADTQGGGVDVRIDGVPYAMRSDGVMRTVAPAAGLATLHIGFGAPGADRETGTIKPGAF